MSPQGDFHSVAGRCFKDLSEALIHEKMAVSLGTISTVIGFDIKHVKNHQLVYHSITTVDETMKDMQKRPTPKLTKLISDILAGKINKAHRNG